MNRKILGLLVVVALTALLFAGTVAAESQTINLEKDSAYGYEWLNASKEGEIINSITVDSNVYLQYNITTNITSDGLTASVIQLYVQNNTMDTLVAGFPVVFGPDPKLQYTTDWGVSYTDWEVESPLVVTNIYAIKVVPIDQAPEPKKTRVMMNFDYTYEFSVPENIVLETTIGGVVGGEVNISCSPVASKDIVMRLNTSTGLKADHRNFSVTQGKMGMNSAMYNMSVYDVKDTGFTHPLKDIYDNRVTGPLNNNTVLTLKAGQSQANGTIGFRTVSLPPTAGLYMGTLTFEVGIEVEPKEAWVVYAPLKEEEMYVNLTTSTINGKKITNKSANPSDCGELNSTSHSLACSFDSSDLVTEMSTYKVMIFPYGVNVPLAYTTVELISGGKSQECTLNIPPSVFTSIPEGNKTTPNLMIGVIP